MLEGKKLTLKLKDRFLFNDVCFRVDAGERIFLTGSSGAGKSVLLRSIALLNPLTTGELWWNDQNVFGEIIPKYRANVLYLHQKPEFVTGSIEENLRLSFSFRSHLHKTYNPMIVRHYLEKIGKSENFLEKDVHHLSGGERQIAALLRGLILEPAIILLDEPTAATDAQITLLIEKLIVDWQEQLANKRSFIWVTHHQDQKERIATTHWHLEDGRLVINQ